INYVDAQGNKLAPAYTATVAYGESYSVASPEIEGYTTDQAVVEGVMGAANVEVNVVYTANETPVEVLPGDANADGVLTSADLSALFAYVMNAGSLTEQGLLNADVNGDGVINTLDVTVLAQLIFGA
ncbi:MAG: MucBP domain-containing protein, partial [Clostridia bacterium]|nr:MucBP domain-containing protein [Clostridia bacterium]